MAGSLRNSRTQALKIGTDKSGFPKDVPYNTDAGMPQAAVGSGHYRESVTPPAPPTLPPQPKPFKVG